MSDATSRMGDRRKVGQKHQNTKAFKPDRYGATKEMKEIQAMPVAGVCLRCKEKIEWKKKFGKYKPLTVPKKW